MAACEIILDICVKPVDGQRENLTKSWDVLYSILGGMLFEFVIVALLIGLLLQLLVTLHVKFALFLYYGALHLDTSNSRLMHPTFQDKSRSNIFIHYV